MNDTNNNPTKNYDDEIDLSNIEILDTSKGDQIVGSTSAAGEIHIQKCLDCGFRYEGNLIEEKCPRCGSENVRDA